MKVQLIDQPTGIGERNNYRKLIFDIGRVLKVPKRKKSYGIVESEKFGKLKFKIENFWPWVLKIVQIDGPVKVEVFDFDYDSSKSWCPDFEKDSAVLPKQGDEVLISYDWVTDRTWYVILLKSLSEKEAERVRRLVWTPLFFAQEEFFGMVRVVWFGSQTSDPNCPKAGWYHTDAPYKIGNDIGDTGGWDKNITWWKCTRDKYYPWEFVV